MTGINNTEDGTWEIDQSGDTAVPVPASTKTSSSLDLNDNDCSPQTSHSIPKVPAVSSPQGKFSAFAVEIRFMVYRHLLVSKTTICRPNVLMGPRRQIMAHHSPNIEDIDGTILRTCRTIYQEARPLLYNENWFYFSWPTDIEQFGHLELQTSPPKCDKAKPMFGLQVEPSGRLAMLRRLVLQLSTPRSHIMQHQFMTDTHREDIWSHWLAFFHPVIEHGLCVGFPALDHLILDFTDWQLGNDYTSQLRVEPFLKKLRVPGGLSSLCLVGVQHQQNLLDFKYGFCKRGGMFSAKRAVQGNTISVMPDTIVVEDGLELVSNGVRAIIQQDEKPS
ncbi:MAG: hypothetical protein ASARMPREDX12_002615 [Alectoria sarmentosa]|nr:MAG: hypothetical protein ASARMPREDX12_002615 [Alectoria sarmentosa]